LGSPPREKRKNRKAKPPPIVDPALVQGGERGTEKIEAYIAEDC